MTLWLYRAVLKRITEYLGKKFSVVNKIHYVTGGGARHLKNKYASSNLLNYKENFGIPAETNFESTAHG